MFNSGYIFMLALFLVRNAPNRLENYRKTGRVCEISAGKSRNRITYSDGFDLYG